MDGLGVIYQGHIIVGDGAEATYFRYGNDESRTQIKPLSRTRSVAVTERVLQKRDIKKSPFATDPKSATYLVNSIESDDAIALLTTQYQLAGAIVMSPDEMKTLREGGRVKRILDWLHGDNYQISNSSEEGSDVVNAIGAFLSPSRKDATIDDADATDALDTTEASDANDPIIQRLQNAINQTKTQATVRRSMSDASTGRSPSRDFADDIAKRFNKKINWIEVDGEGDFDGVAIGGEIYINVNSSVAHNIVLGHELTHTLKKEQPELFDQLAKAILPNATAIEGSARFHLLDKILSAFSYDKTRVSEV